MAQHARFTVETGLQIYCCDPQSPWQRGTNENTSGLLRQYFPKFSSLADVSSVASTRWPPSSTGVLDRHSAG